MKSAPEVRVESRSGETASHRPHKPEVAGSTPASATKVSFVVMADPRRAEMVPSILDKLDAPAITVWDTEQSRWATGRASLLAGDPSADYVCVLQDDCVPCRDLAAGLSQALAYVPEGCPVGLYVGRQRPMRQQIAKAIAAADEKGDSWVIHDGPLWGVGVAIPVPCIPELVAYGDRLGIKNYDLKMQRYFTSKGIKCWYTHPSLVEHRNAPSLWAGPTGHRVAHRFIGADSSALDVDWSKVPPGPRPLAVSMGRTRRR